jgi:hypothetical protein
MGTLGLIAGNDLRRRGRSVLLVALLVGIVGGFTMSAAAGARRTGSALRRFQTSSRAADIELDGEPTAGQLHALTRVPGVAALATLRAYGLVLPAAPGFESIRAPLDAAFGTTVDRARLVEGRAANPAVVDEVTIGEGVADRLGLHVGSFIDAESYSPRQVMATLSGTADVGSPAGPRTRLRVVGIVRRPLDLGDRAAAGGLLVLTPAFDRAYVRKIGIFGTGIRIRTTAGARDVPGVLTASRRIMGDSLFSAQSLTIETQGASNAIDVLSVALWIAAAVAALAGVVATVIVLLREIALVSVDQATLRELGCTRAQRIGLFVPSALLIAVGGGAIAVVAAVCASARYPIGVARRADPSIGIHADWLVLALGFVVVVVSVLTIALFAAYRSTRVVSPAGFAWGRARSTGFAERVAIAGLGPSLQNGVRMALEPGAGSTAVPVRSACFGAICGVLGLTAVLVFGASLDHLVATPKLYGSTWDFTVADATSNAPCGGGDYGLPTLKGIAAVAEVCSQNVQLDGRPVPALAFTDLRGDSITPTIVAGRAARGPQEVALGSKTLHALHKHIGDTVNATRRTGSVGYTIVGEAAFPTIGESQPLAEGAAFTGTGYKPLFDPNLFNRFFVGTFAMGADHTAVERRIAAVPQLGAPSLPTVPVEIGRLRQITWLPVALATMIGGLALLAVGHAIVTSVRRRRRDFAIFKTLGFDRGQVRTAVAGQAMAFGLAGVVIGVPAGLIAGHLVWSVVASGLGVASASIVSPGAIGLAALGALVSVNLVALIPGRAASRTRTGAVLRSG